jgi:hypothetical protein
VTSNNRKTLHSYRAGTPASSFATAQSQRRIFQSSATSWGGTQLRHFKLRFGDDLLMEPGHNAARECDHGKTHTSVIAVLSALINQTWAQSSDSRDVELGRELSAKICSPCHVVGASPNFKTASTSL